MSKYSALGIVFLTSISCLNAMETIDQNNMKFAALRHRVKGKNAGKRINAENMGFTELKDLIKSLNVAFPFCNDKGLINNKLQKFTYSLGQHMEDISAACFSPNRTYCSLGSSNGYTYIYNLNDNTLIKYIDMEKPVTALCWTNDSRYLIIGCKKGSLGVYDVTNGEYLITVNPTKNNDYMEHISEESREISSLCMSPSGKFLVSGYGSGAIMVFDAQQSKEDGWKKITRKCFVQCHKCRTCLVPCRRSRITDLCFNVDDNGKEWLASCAGKKIKIWDFDQIEGEYLIGIKFIDTADVLSICFSPDGKSIASGSADNTIKIWSLDKNEKDEFIDNGGPLYTLSGHSGAVSSVQYNSNGKLLLSGSHDGTVKLWDMKQSEKPEKLKTFKMQSKICHLHLSMDDTHILAGLENSTIRIITFIENNMVDKTLDILLTKKNVQTSLLTLFPSLPTITQLIVALSMQREATLQHLLSEIRCNIKFTD